MSPIYISSPKCADEIWTIHEVWQEKQTNNNNKPVRGSSIYPQSLKGGKTQNVHPQMNRLTNCGTYHRVLFRLKTEILTQTATWMNLKAIMPGK